MSLPVPRLESPRGARFNASIFFPRPFAEPEPRISTLVSWLNACYYSRQDFSPDHFFSLSLSLCPRFFFFFIERLSAVYLPASQPDNFTIFTPTLGFIFRLNFNLAPLIYRTNIFLIYDLITRNKYIFLVLPNYLPSFTVLRPTVKRCTDFD